MINYATNIALVDKATNEVVNIIWGLIYQLEEFANDEITAVQIDNLLVAVGDTYDGTDFFHDGEKVLNIAERQRAELEALQAQLADAVSALELLGVEE